jgi:2-oxoglutarate dehydrogenase E1 component
LTNPENVDPDLKKFFEGFDFALSNAGVNGKEIKADKTVSVQEKQTTSSTPADFNLMAEINVYRMILGYRNKGHLLSKTNPIRERKDRGANIDLSFFGFSDTDLEKEFYAGQFVKLGKPALEIFFHILKNVMPIIWVLSLSISAIKKIDWISNAVENEMLQDISLKKKKRILEKLNQGVMFENFYIQNM